MMSNVAQRVDEDQWIEGFVNDPASVETHQLALEVLACIDRQIANIQMQIDVATIEANAGMLNPARHEWLRRAAFALAMRKRDHEKINRRDREIRHMKGPAQTPLSADRQAKRDVGIIKNQRLLAEAEARREKTARLASLEHRFFRAAELMLPPATFQEVLRAAEIAEQI